MSKFIIELVVLLFFLIIGFGLPTDLFAQVVINEFSSSTSNDWVEIYSPEDVDISGWTVHDDSEDPIGDPVPDGTIIGPTDGKYYVLEVGRRLNRDGDDVALVSSDMKTEIDKVTYNDKDMLCIPTDSGSLGRHPDGSDFTRFSNNTKGISNDEGVIDTCPSPTPTPKPTPTDKPDNIETNNDPDPTNTPTPKPTKSPTPTKKKATPTKLSSRVPTKTALNIDLDDSGSGEDIGVDDLRNKLDGEVLGAESGSNSNFPIGAFLLVGSGICFVTASGYLIQKKRKEDNGKENDDE